MTVDVRLTVQQARALKALAEAVHARRRRDPRFAAELNLSDHLADELHGAADALRGALVGR